MNKTFIYKSLTVLLLISAILLLSGCGPNLTPNEEALPNIAQIHVIDIGQGDSTLIRSNNTAILVDTGPSGKKNDLTAYLDDQGVEKIDAMILSHPHTDHIGGAGMIMENFEVSEIIMPNAYTTTVTFEKLLDSAENRNIPINTVFRGDKFEIGDFKFTVFSPDDKSYADLNNTSIVMKVEFDEVSLMFTGDAEALVEKEILEEFDSTELDCDFLKVAHHGSSSSNTEDFILAISPEFSTISCEADNSYGHPHRETRELFEKLNLSVYRTDIDGNIVFETDGKSIVKK